MRHGKTYKKIIIFLCLTFLVLYIKNIWNEESIQDHQTEKGTESVKINKEMKKSSHNQVKKEGYYPEQTYPDAETIPDSMICPEEYSPYPEEIPITCYFTNTEKTLDAKGVFPLAAQGTLLESMQQWLNYKGFINVKELRCMEDSLNITKNNISFMAECVDIGGKVIRVTYDLQVHAWSFDG